jgi:hypothetical protein
MKRHALAALIALATASGSGFAAGFLEVGIGFENVLVPDDDGVFLETEILDFYNGGASQAGTKFPQDLGVRFSAGALAVMSSSAGGTGNFADPSPKEGVGAMFFSGPSAVMSFAQGFNVGFSMWVSSASTGSVRLFSGVDGTGNQVGETQTFSPNTDGCPPLAKYCNWSLVKVELPTGVTARSVVFGGVSNDAHFDMVTFGRLDPFIGVTPVPEPSTYALMALGLAAVAGAARRRQARAG